MSKALFGAGCFWGIEEYFSKINGVNNTAVGYSGGNTENPTYEEVCQGDTEHVEVVEINFDENIISYESLLEHFWNCHDPTQLNRQGPDVGRQYRSAIFYYSDNQKYSVVNHYATKQQLVDRFCDSQRSIFRLTHLSLVQSQDQCEQV